MIQDTDNGSAQIPASYQANYQRKLALLTELHRMTEEADVAAPVDDEEPDIKAEVFISLYDRRSAILAELAEVHEKLPRPPVSANDTALSKQCDEIIKKIVEMDRFNLGAGKELFDSVKGNIRRINQTRKLNMRYTSPNITDGHRLDNKN